MTRTDRGPRYIYTYPGQYLPYSMSESEYLGQLLTIFNVAMNTPSALVPQQNNFEDNSMVLDSEPEPEPEPEPEVTLPADFNIYQPIFHTHKIPRTNIEQQYKDLLEEQKKQESNVPERDIRIFDCSQGYFSRTVLLDEYNKTQTTPPPEPSGIAFIVRFYVNRFEDAF